MRNLRSAISFFRGLIENDETELTITDADIKRSKVKVEQGVEIA